MISILTPAGSKTIAAMSILTPEGSKDIAAASVLAPGGDLAFWSGAAGELTVSVSPDPAGGAVAQPFAANITTRSTTAIVSDGVAPLTYAWTQLSGTGDWEILSPSSATTTFRRNEVEPGDTQGADFEITVTDARGRTGTASVSAYASNYGGLGGGNL